MKKLMIAAAIVCAAAFANAASYTWSVSGVTDAPGAAEGVADGNYSIYTFITADSSGQNTIQTVDAILAAFAEGNYPEDLDGVWTGAVKGTGSGSVTGNVTVTGAGPTSPITIHTMGLVTDSWNPGDPGEPETPVMANYQIIDFGETVFYDGNGKTAYGTAGNDWKSVPEPTSGLLLLLGVAGLALRRRRA